MSLPSKGHLQWIVPLGVMLLFFVSAFVWIDRLSRSTPYGKAIVHTEDLIKQYRLAFEHWPENDRKALAKLSDEDDGSYLRDLLDEAEMTWRLESLNGDVASYRVKFYDGFRQQTRVVVLAITPDYRDWAEEKDDRFVR